MGNAGENVPLNLCNLNVRQSKFMIVLAPQDHLFLVQPIQQAHCGNMYEAREQFFGLLAYSNLRF